MATRMRLRRAGKKKQAHYRVVVADSRSPRDGRFIEIVGHYDPNRDPAHIEFKEERTLYWLKNGAMPTDTVRSLLSRKGLLAKLAEEHPDHAVLRRVARKKGRKGADAEAVAAAEEAVPEGEKDAGVETAVEATEPAGEEDAGVETAVEAAEPAVEEAAGTEPIGDEAAAVEEADGEAGAADEEAPGGEASSKE